MAGETYYLIHDGSGKIIGTGVAAPGADVPAQNTVRCTVEQMKGWQWATLQDGQIVAGSPSLEVSAMTTFRDAIGQGCRIVSSSDPLLNGVYGLDATSVADLGVEVLYVQTFGEFSGGQPSFQWPDVTGKMHEFTSTTTFIQFTRALADYVTRCKVALREMRSGRPYAWPRQLTVIG